MIGNLIFDWLMVAMMEFLRVVSWCETKLFNCTHIPESSLTTIMTEGIYGIMPNDQAPNITNVTMGLPAIITDY